MKKFSLLLGALGGGFAGYLFSNKKLRDELTQSKDAEQAAKTLGKHLQRDGQKLGLQVREFIESEDVKKHVTKARQFAKKKVDEAKKELKSTAQKSTKQVKATVKKKAASAKKVAKNKVRSAANSMKHARGRVRTKTRKLS